jgi:arsenate reductase
MSIKIYHNPRCSKSRRTLEIIESKGVSPTIVPYLSTPPEADELVRIAGLLEIPLVDLLRRGEAEFKEAGGSVPLDDQKRLAEWIHENPKVLQRPIVVNEESGRAVVGRPPENVLDIL